MWSGVGTLAVALTMPHILGGRFCNSRCSATVRSREAFHALLSPFALGAVLQRCGAWSGGRPGGTRPTSPSMKVMLFMFIERLSEEEVSGRETCTRTLPRIHSIGSVTYWKQPVEAYTSPKTTFPPKIVACTPFSLIFSCGTLRISSRSTTASPNLPTVNDPLLSSSAPAYAAPRV